MSKRRTPPAPTATDSLIADVFRSPEYLESLKARLLSGTAKASEVMIARELLGLTVPQNDGDDEIRDAYREMDPVVRGMLGDLLRLSDTPAGARLLKVIRAGSIVGLGWDTSSVPVEQNQTPNTEPPVIGTDDEVTDLMPRKVPA